MHDSVIRLHRRKLQRRNDVFRLQVWILGQHLFVRGAGREQPEDVGDAYPETAETGPPSALLGINRNAMEM